MWGVGGDGAPERYEPTDPTHFGTHVQVLIGTRSGDRSDSFDLTVCSPSWFAEQVAEGTLEGVRSLRVFPEAVIPGASVWFMRRWDPAELRNALKVVCDSASPGPDWGSVASRVGRLIPWEYDYRYDAHVDSHPGPPFPP